MLVANEHNALARGLTFVNIPTDLTAATRATHCFQPKKQAESAAVKTEDATTDEASSVQELYLQLHGWWRTGVS